MTRSRGPTSRPSSAELTAQVQPAAPDFAIRWPLLHHREGARARVSSSTLPSGSKGYFKLVRVTATTTSSHCDPAASPVMREFTSAADAAGAWQRHTSAAMKAQARHGTGLPGLCDSAPIAATTTLARFLDFGKTRQLLPGLFQAPAFVFQPHQVGSTELKIRRQFGLAGLTVLHAPVEDREAAGGAAKAHAGCAVWGSSGRAFSPAGPAWPCRAAPSARPPSPVRRRRHAPPRARRARPRCPARRPRNGR